MCLDNDFFFPDAEWITALISLIPKNSQIDDTSCLTVRAGTLSCKDIWYHSA
jgi:hypothetical protein